MGEKLIFTYGQIKDIFKAAAASAKTRMLEPKTATEVITIQYIKGSPISLKYVISETVNCGMGTQEACISYTSGLSSLIDMSVKHTLLKKGVSKEVVEKYSKHYKVEKSCAYASEPKESDDFFMSFELVEL